MDKRSELKRWKRKTWKLMSEWVRRGSADWRGYVSCYTCGKTIHYKQSHASHFFHGKLDYDERNLKACCVQCNLYLSGNLAQYAIRLTQENGLKWVEKLKSDAFQHPGYSIEEIKKIHGVLKVKIKNLCQKE